MNYCGDICPIDVTTIEEVNVFNIHIHIGQVKDSFGSVPVRA